MKKILALLAIVVLFIGGCSMGTLHKYEKLDIQEKMVEHVIQTYDEIHEIEIKDFYEDKKTGYYSSEILINGKYSAVARMNKDNEIVSLDYGEDFFVNIKKRTQSKEFKEVKIKYLEE